MFAGGKNAAVVISFPDLSPAEASILAKELSQELSLLDDAAANQITLSRASDDAQDLGSILAIAVGSGLGAGLIELAKEIGKGVVGGAASRVGQKAFDAIWPILRKWWTRAKIETPSGDVIILGEERSRPAPPLSTADAETLANLKTLGLVILGASTFPHYPASRKLNNAAFKRSAELAKKVLSPTHTVFRKVEVLDLFDQDLRPDDIVDRIEDHVEAHPDMRDVMLYYCGHGDLLPDREHTYYLVLKGTKPGREVATGLGIKQFRTMIEAKGVLPSRRCTFILDCCFAGEAAGAWQNAGLNTLIDKQIRDVLPSPGFAFLTASDKNLRAWGKGGYEGATMFTGALAEVLTAEADPVKHLSLGDLCAAMVNCIRERHGDWKEAVIPQCHAPGQQDGDISRIRMFLVGSPAWAPIQAWPLPVTASKPAWPDECEAEQAVKPLSTPHGQDVRSGETSIFHGPTSSKIETQVASNASERNLDIADWHWHFAIMLVFYCLLSISGYALFGRKFDKFRSEGIDVVFWSGALTIYIYIIWKSFARQKKKFIASVFLVIFTIVNSFTCLSISSLLVHFEVSPTVGIIVALIFFFGSFFAIKRSS